MEVEFILRPEDVMRLAEYVWDHTPRLTAKLGGVPRWVWGGLGLLCLCLGLAYATWVLPSRWQGNSSAAFYFGLMQLFSAAVSFPVIRLLCRHLCLRRTLSNVENGLEKSAKELGWKRLTLSEQGITETTRYTAGTTGWAVIGKIVVRYDYAFIFDSPTSAYIVPQRAFVNGAEFRDFLATARRYRDAARNARAEERSAGR